MARDTLLQLLSSAALLGTAVACTGQVGDADMDRVIQSDSLAQRCADQSPTLGVSPLTRLTRTEYDHSVRELLGTGQAPAQAFSVDEQLGVFTRNAGISVTPLQLNQYSVAAEALAKEAVADLDNLLPCDPAVGGADACVRTFVETFARKAYRRPLSSDEAEALDQVGRAYAGPDGSLADRVEGVLLAVLQSPKFLYRVELGAAEALEAGAVADLTAFELATRLSFFLWSSTPDDALMDAAAAGELDEPEGLATWAERMMEDPRFGDSLESVVQQWLGLEDLSTMTARDAKTYPEFNDELRASLYEETISFFEHVVTKSGGTLEELFTAPYTFADPALASLYGVEHPGGDGFAQVDLDTSQRAGLLTQASFLSLGAHPNQSSPIRRGVAVRERFLCDPPPPPPPNVDDAPPPPKPGQTTRERFALHTESPACAGCHALIDPVGWGLEEYDALGRFRTEDLGLAIDASGALTQTEDADGPFVGAVELGQRLGASGQVHDCAVQLTFEYGMGRVAGCESRPLEIAFRESGGDLRGLFLAIITSEAFRVRRAGDVTPVSQGEGSQ